MIVHVPDLYLVMQKSKPQSVFLGKGSQILILLPLSDQCVCALVIDSFEESYSSGQSPGAVHEEGWGESFPA